MRAIKQGTLIWWICPPRGIIARRILAGMCLAVALPRLPFVADIVSFAPQKFGPPEFYGVLLLLAGVGLILTTTAHRLNVRGRVAAGLAFVMFATLAFATTSTTSLLVDLMIAYVAFGEMTAMTDG